MSTITNRTLALLGLVAASVAPLAATASPQRAFPAPAEATQTNTSPAPLLAAPSWENSNAIALAPFLSGQTALDRSGATGGNGQGN